MRIGVLTNLNAGGGGARAGKVLEHLRRYPEIVRAQTDNPDALRELAAARVDILAVNGGDGTLQKTLTEVLREGSPFGRNGDPRELPIIAPLRTGRTSMSAYDIGSPRDARVAIDRLVTRARSGRVGEWLVRRAALRMTLEPDGVDHWGTFFGVGVIYRGTLLTHRIFPKGKAQGAFGSAVVTAGLVARAITGRAPVATDGEEHPLTIDPITVDLDGARLDAGQFQLLMATTLHRLFAGIRPFWGKGPGGIRFTTLGPGCLRRPQELARVLRGIPPKRDADVTALYASRNVEQVDLVLDCGISLDGEMFPPVAGRRASLLADHRIRFLSTR
ncbi:MAG TPA: diacylglycerol kinase family protein [Candidatus Binatia bacterium]